MSTRFLIFCSLPNIVDIHLQYCQCELYFHQTHTTRLLNASFLSKLAVQFIFSIQSYPQIPHLNFPFHTLSHYLSIHFYLSRLGWLFECDCFRVGCIVSKLLHKHHQPAYLPSDRYVWESVVIKATLTVNAVLFLTQDRDHLFDLFPPSCSSLSRRSTTFTLPVLSIYLVCLFSCFGARLSSLPSHFCGDIRCYISRALC